MHSTVNTHQPLPPELQRLARVRPSNTAAPHHHRRLIHLLKDLERAHLRSELNSMRSFARSSRRRPIGLFMRQRISARKGAEGDLFHLGRARPAAPPIYTNDTAHRPMRRREPPVD